MRRTVRHVTLAAVVHLPRALILPQAAFARSQRAALRAELHVRATLSVHINNMKKEDPMKSNTTISLTGLLARYLTLALVTLTLAFAPNCGWANESVPFKGSAAGAIVAASPGPGGVLATVVASGRATQLGQFSREESVLLNPASGTITGTVVFTAANGDQLFGTVAGQFTSPNTAVGSYTFTGGTGRFENAAGEADFSLATPDGIHFTVAFDGSVSSVGANKK